MSTKAALVKLYEMILSMPGMNDEIKISIKVSRKNVLFLGKIIERGLSDDATEEKKLNDLELISPDTRGELFEMNKEILLKAGLSDVYEKLQHF